MSKSLVAHRLVGRVGIVVGALIAASALPLSASAQAIAPPSPVTATRFVITISGTEVGSFSALSGITSEVPPTEYIAAGPSAGLVHTKQFGKTKPPTITLTRGIDTAGEFWAWHQAVLNGDPAARKDAELVFASADGTQTTTYVLHNAWPTMLAISGMKAGTSEVVIDSVTLTADSITYKP